MGGFKLPEGSGPFHIGGIPLSRLKGIKIPADQIQTFENPPEEKKESSKINKKGKDDGISKSPR